MLAVPDPPAQSASSGIRWVALTGNPNCGKTTLFNALTGLRAKVGNYPGVTVERKEGRLQGAPKDLPITILDLPGTYSLSAQSLDEEISRDVLLNRVTAVPPPDCVVVVVDAANLERNLYYATQVIDLGYPVVVALNMVDVAEANGAAIDAQKLSQELGVPVVPMVASQGKGLAELKDCLVREGRNGFKQDREAETTEFPAAVEEAVQRLTARVSGAGGRRHSARMEALLMLSDERSVPPRAPEELKRSLREARQGLDGSGEDWRGAVIESRYARVAAIHRAAQPEAAPYRETLSDKLDRVLTHKFWGMLCFVGVMAVIFQSIFSFAEYPMTWLEEGVGWVGENVGAWIPEGDLRSLLVDGVIAGVGAVVVFLPQILLLFLFIGLLEDTGYMARAAFLMDRLMSKVGLHGKSFIPMLSSFACAIPGIMATRTIENPKDRLATILVAPLMSCSARLPVYTLLIAACIPNRQVFGFFGMQGLTLLGMYLLGATVAFLMAWLFKRTILRGEPPLLIMELPPYKKPVLRVVLRHMWERSKLFLKRAGTIILGVSILLWFLATYPRGAETERFEAARQQVETAADLAPDEREEALLQIELEESGEALRQSFAGRMGRLIEPVIEPLGFDWKIGIGIVASFAAREVFVSTMSTVYNVAGTGDGEEETQDLAQTLREQRREDGTRIYTPLVGMSLMVFYVFALQCVSTVAVVRRETNSWRWPLFQWLYMGVLAWGFAFLIYQGGRLLGWE